MCYSCQTRLGPNPIPDNFCCFFRQEAKELLNPIKWEGVNEQYKLLIGRNWLKGSWSMQPWVVQVECRLNFFLVVDSERSYNLQNCRPFGRQGIGRWKFGESFQVLSFRKRKPARMWDPCPVHQLSDFLGYRLCHREGCQWGNNYSWGWPVALSPLL